MNSQNQNQNINNNNTVFTSNRTINGNTAATRVKKR